MGLIIQVRSTGLMYIRDTVSGGGHKWTVIGAGTPSTTDSFVFTTRDRLLKTIDSMKLVNDGRYQHAGATAGGDLTGTYPNPTIGSNKVTLAKIIAGTPNTLIGYDGSGNAHEITAGTNVTISGNQISATGGISFPRPNVVWSAAPDTITVPDGTSVLTINPVADSPYLMVILPTVGNANDSLFTIEVGGSITSGEVIAHVQVKAPGGQSILQSSTPGGLRAGDAIQYHQVGSLWRRRF